MAKFLFIEPFYGGSHKYFIDGLKKYSRHEIDLVTLPARFWKWRMRGAAVYLTQQETDFSQYDGIIASNMLSLSDFKALAGPEIPPLILYFHENQILYPLSEGEREDLHYGFTDFTSALCSDSIIFNSKYHMKAFLGSLPDFLTRFPDNRPDSSLEELKKKSLVIHPGCHLEQDFDDFIHRSDSPVIIWNHRWEHDKNPEDFFDVLFALEEENVPFRVAVLGEQYSNSPEIFQVARKRLAGRIIHFGYADNYEEYKKVLGKGNIVISTAIQENFGISVVEAIGTGNFPLLPDRLSYRELIPPSLHKLCIYKNKKDLKKKLKKLIERYDPELVRTIVRENLRFSWPSKIKDYDTYLDRYKKNPV